MTYPFNWKPISLLYFDFYKEKNERIGLQKSDQNKGIGLTIPITITSDYSTLCIWMIVLCYNVE